MARSMVDVKYVSEGEIAKAVSDLLNRCKVWSTKGGVDVSVTGVLIDDVADAARRITRSEVSLSESRQEVQYGPLTEYRGLIYASDRLVGWYRVKYLAPDLVGWTVLICREEREVGGEQGEGPGQGQGGPAAAGANAG